MSLVRRTAQAQDDLVEIWVFIAEDNPSAADRFIETIDQKCRLLARTPELGQSREELAPSLRSFPIGNYTIFYRPLETGIELIRVLSSYRDIPSLFP